MTLTPTVERTAIEPIVLGLENELGVGVRDPTDAPKLRQVMADFIPALQQITPALPRSEGRGSPPGLMLANGGSIYLDGPNFLENATAEVRDPEAALVYQRAGERLILKALPLAVAKAGLTPDDLCLTRAVTDYNGKYCGAHFNVLLRRHEATDLVDYIVPFLVTRFYACAGGWSSTGLVMSHKADAVCCTASEDTRYNRGIVNTKNESLAKSGYSRIHLTHGDALMSDWGTYLTLGCTALVLRMLDDGVTVGLSMALNDPVAACRRLNTDFTWQRPLELKCGAEASGLQIQEQFLLTAEAYAEHQHEPWMCQVVTYWRHAVDALKENLANLSGKLDPYIKIRSYNGVLKQQGMTLPEFSRWCGAISLIRNHLRHEDLPHQDIKPFLRERLPFVSFALLVERMESQRLSWSHLHRALELWRLMVHTDLQYHDISERGLFWRLRSSGAINSRLVSDDAITCAMDQPPQGTRATARSLAIRVLAASEGGVASWRNVSSARRRMDLSDPFATQGKWLPTGESKNERSKR